MKRKSELYNRFFGLHAMAVLTLFLVYQAQISVAQPPGSSTEPVLSKASIYIDRSNKKNTSGHVYITHAVGSRLKSPRGTGGGIINLKEAMKKWTNIEARVDPQVRLSSPALLKQPFVYVVYDGSFEITETEKVNIQKYLMNGGFMVVENIGPAMGSTGAGSQFEKMMKNILGSQGRVSRLRNSNELYHCFFDFPNGPPQGGEKSAKKIGWASGPVNDPKTGVLIKPGIESFETPKDITYLEGVTVNGRIAAVFSQKRYIEKWKERTNNEPQLRMGVNMIVFAVTQKGGLTRQ